MALRLYLSPTEKAGGYPGLPRQTQCFASPWGAPPYNGAWAPNDGYFHYNAVVGAGRILPVFPFTTVKPTGAATAVNWDIPVTLQWNAGGNSYPYNTSLNLIATPTLLGVIGLAADMTVNPNDFIPGTANPVTGQWVYEWYPNNWLLNSYVENQYGLLPANAYIWRPSTASMVGFLWGGTSQFGGGFPNWGLATESELSTQYQGPAPWVGDQDPASYLWVNGGFGCRRSEFNQGGNIISAYTQSVAALAGDVMVVEFWKFNRVNVQGWNVGQLECRMRGRQTIGGGFDATLIQGRDVPPDGYNLAFETTPTRNTFVELPTLTPLTFPTEEPAGASGGKLIRVTPRAGKGLTLEFDAATGMTGPTIDGPVDGIGVPSVTQSDETHIDIDIDVPPTHPIGEAEVPTLPDPPKGGGAFTL